MFPVFYIYGKGFVMEENLPKQDGKLKENSDFDPRFDRITKAYEKLGPEHIVKEIVLKNGVIFTVYDAIIN